jgi:hypothetical protein
MRNKVSCVAQKLSQLDPAMIESVVKPDAFSIGRKYAVEHRAQILEVDDISLNSSVIGTHGLYAQSLRLKGGNLHTKCSCPLTEQPFCRHCVAALLAHYYRSQREDIEHPSPSATITLKPQEPQEPQESQTVAATVIDSVPNSIPISADPPVSDPPEDPPDTSLELGFREVTQFIEWMQPAIAAMAEGDALPAVPDRVTNQVKRWVESVRELDEARRSSEARCMAQASELKTHQVQVGRLTQELDSATQAAKHAQVIGDDLRRELELARGALTRLAGFERDNKALESRLQTVLGAMREKGDEIDRLTSTLKSVSDSLKALGDSSPS